MTPELTLSAHAKMVDGKLTFLRALLAPVLRRGRARFNVSLFRTLALPLYRLAYPLYDLAYSDDQDAFRVSIRKKTRAFLAIPPTTPNRIVEGLLGDLGPMAMGVSEATDSLLDSKKCRMLPDLRLLRILSEPTRTKLLPDCTLLALRITYGKKCTLCQTPLLVSHMMAHQGLQVGLDAALEQYQLPLTRMAGRKNMRAIIKMALQLGVPHKDSQLVQNTIQDKQPKGGNQQ